MDSISLKVCIIAGMCLFWIFKDLQNRAKIEELKNEIEKLEKKIKSHCQ